VQNFLAAHAVHELPPLLE
jgi:hypothetical protein